MTGFVHPGGEYKQHAQCLFTMVNSLSTTSGADKISNGIFTQYLTRSINDSQDMSYAKLIPNTHYRLGITWKGDIQGSVSSNSKTFAKFQWGPTTYHGSADTNHYQGAMLSTSELLNSGSPTQSTYTTNMVSGYVGAVNTDLLDPDNNNLKIEVIQQAATASTTVAAQNNRGGEIKTFIDSIWLEHEGDLANASGNGYVEIDHAPAQGTLSINRFEAVKPKTVILADGTSEKIDTTGFNKRWLYKIKADFNYTNADIWETFRSLMKWQDKGYKLALHPFLPEIPHCLVGFLEIQNIRKSFWDLNKFTFSVQFTETD